MSEIHVGIQPLNFPKKCLICAKIISLNFIFYMSVYTGHSQECTAMFDVKNRLSVQWYTFLDISFKKIYCPCNLVYSHINCVAL